MPLSSPTRTFPFDREALLAALETTKEEKAAALVVSEMLHRQYKAMSAALMKIMYSNDIPPYIQLSLGLIAAGALESMYEAATRARTHADITRMIGNLDEASEPLVSALSQLSPETRSALINEILNQARRHD